MSKCNIRNEVIIKVLIHILSNNKCYDNHNTYVYTGYAVYKKEIVLYINLIQAMYQVITQY